MVACSGGEDVGPLRAGDSDNGECDGSEPQDGSELHGSLLLRAGPLSLRRQKCSPLVLQAQRLFGDPDYLLRICTADLDAYARLEDDVLSTLPGVQRVNSTLVMKSFVLDRP